MGLPKDAKGQNEIEVYLTSLGVPEMRDIVKQHMIKKVKALNRDALCTYIQENRLLPRRLGLGRARVKQPSKGYMQYDGRNSCYIDTFLTCFILSNPKWFKKYICKGKFEVFRTSDLTAAAEMIKTELTSLYKHLVLKKTLTSCRSLRGLFAKFDDLYDPALPTEWLREQNDPNEVVELLNRVFQLPPTIKVKGSGSLPFSGISVHAKQDNAATRVGDYIPITKEWVEDIQRHRTIKYLSADYLYVNVLRNLDDEDKTSSPVIPEPKLILAENKTPLRLKAIVIHNGKTPHSGHYTAVLRLTGGWYYYDDMSDKYTFLGKSMQVVMKDEYIRNCVGFFYA
jgi:hypothetical protein